MSFVTLAKPASHEIEVKKSRFLALARCVDSPEAAMAFLAELSDAEATHNCWAYRIGGLYRSSDDGEPGGSAGRPILAAIDGQGLDHVFVVVTRWYGGTKLGVGGLIRAYGGCAAECLRLAATVEVLPMHTLRVACAFADEAICRRVLGGFSASIMNTDYQADGLVMMVEVQADQVDELVMQLTNATKGSVKMDGMDE